jgi:hypothetical protein
MTMYTPNDMDTLNNRINILIQKWNEKHPEFTQVTHNLHKLDFFNNDGVLFKLFTTTERGEKITLGYFGLNQFPFNCGCVMLFNLTSSYHHKKGVGKLLLECAKTITKECRYSMMIATTNGRGGNKIFYDMAIKDKWKPADEFLNRRSRNTCNIITKQLKGR